MTATITAIKDSDDLAAVLNAKPLTPEDAAETPRDWLAGIWVSGTVYPLDPQATTDTLAVLAAGTAAARLTEPGEFCGRPRHNHYQAHWCPADTDTVEWEADGEPIRGIERDWRKVYVWDANGYSDTTVYPTVDAAKEAFASEETAIDEMDGEDEEVLYEETFEVGGTVIDENGNRGTILELYDDEARVSWPGRDVELVPLDEIHSDPMGD